ncbi:MAG: hypothetical protein JXI43_09005 [Tissierellales bacterium]|nr:hypothetical protein [Tissierellales bacterium]
MNTEKQLQKIEEKLQDHLKGEKRRRFTRFTLAAFGSIPWIGGFLSASAAIDAEKDQNKINEFQRQWLEEHKVKIIRLGETLNHILGRLDSFDEEVKERIESEEYLDLVRKGFRQWDKADTDEKRELIKNLLTNAGATKLCPDDLVRLFLDWIEKYHEIHFRVIKEIFNRDGITRGEIWDKTGGERPREDSAEADVFKLLIHDLSIGHVIRQHRETDYYGNFIKKPMKSISKSSSGTMKSAFDDSEEYELTELGKQFVHYTMNEVVPRISNE